MYFPFLFQHFNISNIIILTIFLWLVSFHFNTSGLLYFWLVPLFVQYFCFRYFSKTCVRDVFFLRLSRNACSFQALIYSCSASKVGPVMVSSLGEGAIAEPCYCLLWEAARAVNPVCWWLAFHFVLLLSSKQMLLMVKDAESGSSTYQESSPTDIRCLVFLAA